MSKKKWFKHHTKSIKRQMIYSNLLVVGTIAVIVSIFSYVTAYNRTEQISTNALRYHVDTLSDQYDLAYDEMKNMVLNCAESNMFDLRSIKGFSSLEEKKQGLQYNKLLSGFAAISGYSRYITKLMVANNEGIFIQTGSALGSADDYKRIVGKPWFEAELKKSMDYYQLDLMEPLFYKDKNKILPIAKYTSKTQSWVLLCISARLYEDILKENVSENETYVVTHTGQIITSTNATGRKEEEIEGLIQDFIKEEEQKDLLELKIHNKKALVAYNRSLQSGITVIEILPFSEMKDDKLALIWTVVIIFFACNILGFIMSILFTKQVSKPIDELADHIKKIAGGDFMPNQSIESDDEIGSIGKAINNMSMQIDEYMKQKIMDEKEKRELELKMLQAQINPHFLYNTLDSVKWIATIQKNTGIVKIVTALIGLLKNMAKGFDEKVTIKQELDFLNDYVTIEKVKYVELFDLEVHVDQEALYNAKIIKLTLQPLVENAIFYGIEPSRKNGMIQIHVYQEDEDLLITVKDNGVGIPSSKLNDILNGIRSKKSNHMSGIGLSNVEKRIKINYGECYGLTIRSNEGEYTEIIIRIPLEF